MRKLLPFILSAVLVVFVAAYWVLNYTGNNADLADGRTCVITVENGMTAADIANMLHKEKLIKRPESFRLEARFMGLEGKLQAGKYEIEAGKSNSEIIDILARGQVKTVSFTVPEGYTVNKIAATRLTNIWKPIIRTLFIRQKALFTLQRTFLPTA